MIEQRELEADPLFKLLPRALLARVASRAADIRAGAGEWIVREGDPAYYWAVIEGEVEIVRIVAGEERRVTTFDPGESFGEVPLVLGSVAAADVRAIRASRLARIDAVDFHAILVECPDAANAIASTLVRRVNYIRDDYASAETTQATIVGDRYDIACHDLRDFLARNQVAFEWFDPSQASDAACVPDAARSAARLPVVVFANGDVLECPTIGDLARRLGLATEPAGGTYDVVIVGGGPAGLAAAVYGGSEGLRTMLVEREAPGGQAGTSSRIENYLGFPGGISGGDLANRALLQAKRFGTEILVTRTVETIESTADGHRLCLDGDATVVTKAVVVATGVTWRRLDVPGVERLIGRGIYYGAARTEALGTRGKDVYLVGGGNSAGQAAMFFANYARSVTLLVRGPSLEKSMSFYLIEQLRGKANVRVESDAVLVAVDGTDHLQTIETRDVASGETRRRSADALFAFIGADAQTSWLPESVERDGRGFVCTGHDLAGPVGGRTPFALETSVAGIFAAGDVRANSVKRVAAGVGEGSMVIAYVHDYLALGDRAASAAASGR